MGYTLADSLSGERRLSQPPRCRIGDASRPRLYRGAVGDLIHARGVIEALAAGRIDVGPLDSYYHDLLGTTSPRSPRRCASSRAPSAMPIPPLVATAELEPQATRTPARSVARRGRCAGACGAARAACCLQGFAVPDPADYEALPEARQAAASRAGEEDTKAARCERRTLTEP